MFGGGPLSDLLVFDAHLRCGRFNVVWLLWVVLVYCPGTQLCVRSVASVCLTLCNPIDCSQAPLAMGFSRQERWSGRPCPPVGTFPARGLDPGLLRLLHWQAGALPRVPPGSLYTVGSESRSVASDSATLCDGTVHGILQARILEYSPFPSPGDLPNPGIKPRSPALQADSLPAEPQGNPKYTQLNWLKIIL